MPKRTPGLAGNPVALGWIAGQNAPYGDTQAGGMDEGYTTGTTTALPRSALPAGRRADAGTIRPGRRDIAGLLLGGEMYGAPYDLLAQFLDVRPDRLRAIAARWRRAGYAQTGRLGPGQRGAG